MDNTINFSITSYNLIVVVIVLSEKLKINPLTTVSVYYTDLVLHLNVEYKNII